MSGGNGWDKWDRRDKVNQNRTLWRFNRIRSPLPSKKPKRSAPSRQPQKSKGNQMAQRGGKRSGAGRPQGRRNRATVAHKLTLEELARSHTEVALGVLVEIAQRGQSEAARVSAANAILDRGYGKPRQIDPEPLPEKATNEQKAPHNYDPMAAVYELLDKHLSPHPTEVSS